MCSSTRLLAPVIAILSGEFLPSPFQISSIRFLSFFLSFFVSLFFNDDDDVCAASIGQQQQRSPFGEYVRRLQGEQAARRGGRGDERGFNQQKGEKANRLSAAGSTGYRIRSAVLSNSNEERSC